MVRRRLWIPTKHTKRLMRKLEYLWSFPPMKNMPNLLIVGDSGAGKTSLIEELLHLHPRYESPDQEKSIIPIVYCEAPPDPDLGGFYNEILFGMGLPPSKGRVDARRHHVQEMLILVEARLLVIDEVHHGLHSGPQTRRVYLNAIKSLGNHVGVPIVAVGIREALVLFAYDPQIKRRFEKDELPALKCDNEFRRVLVSLERLTVLRKASFLGEVSMARRLYDMSKGTMGKLARVVAAAAAKAIETGEERISYPILDAVETSEI